jgi:antitoxin CptB
MPARTLQRIAMSLPAIASTLTGGGMDQAARISRAKFRAWHRGTREADYLVGGFFDQHHRTWDERQLTWFEAMLEEQDADILAWALQAQAVPNNFAGPMMRAMQKLDYVKV